MTRINYFIYFNSHLFLGFRNVKEFIEYFCHIDLSEDPKLPQGCCKSCYYTIRNFCIFTVSVEKVQNRLINQLSSKILEKASVHEINSQDSKKNENNVKNINISNNESLANSKREKEILASSTENKSSSSKTGNLSCEVNKNENSIESPASTSRGSSNISTGSFKRKHDEQIFSDESVKKPRKPDLAKNRKDKLQLEKTLDENLSQVQELFKDFQKTKKDYVRVTIKDELLNQETGEVPPEYLRRFKDFKTYQDFEYPCLDHCSKKVKSLRSLLDHYDQHELPLYKRGFTCGLCNQSFTKQTANITWFLNHMGTHLPHLKFSCCYCEKVFVNVSSLAKHLKEHHSTRKLRFFPCFDCGLTFPTFEKLKDHKGKHDTDE